MSDLHKPAELEDWIRRWLREASLARARTHFLRAIADFTTMQASAISRDRVAEAERCEDVLERLRAALATADRLAITLDSAQRKR